MSYPKRTLQFRPTRGFISDVPASEVGPDYWAGSIGNVIFRNGLARRVGGSRAAYGTLPIDPVLHALNARIGTTNYWLVFGEDEVYALETENSDDVTPSGGLQAVLAPHYYASTLLNGVPVFTNGLDAPQYWTGDVGTPFATLPDWPEGAVCGSIAAFKFHLFALDIDESAGHFEGKIMWSHAAEPGTVPDSWTPAADNEAGSAELADTPGPLRLAVPLRGSLILYKRSSTYAADYVGGNEVFVFRTLFTSSGALTRRAACDVNGQHFVVTDGDIILTDGTNRRSVGQARMREYLFANLDSDNYENLFVTYNRSKGEVYVGFPETGNTYCTKALVYDVANDSFGVVDLPSVTFAVVGVVNDTAPSEIIDDQDIIIDEDTRTLNQVNFSLATESLVLGYGDTLEQQDTSDAVTRNAVIGRYDLTMDAPERVKFVRRVHVRTSPNSGQMFVRVGARMSPTAEIVWSAEQKLEDGEQVINVMAQGRYISIEIRSASGEVWQISGVDIEYEMRGYH